MFEKAFRRVEQQIGGERVVVEVLVRFGKVAGVWGG